MRQCLFEVGVHGHAVIYLLLPVIDPGKPLVHAHDRRYPGRGPQHPYMPRAPITHSYDAYPNSIGLHSHTTPLVLNLRLALSGTPPIFGSLTYLRLKRHPRTGGRAYVRLGVMAACHVATINCVTPHHPVRVIRTRLSPAPPGEVSAPG